MESIWWVFSELYKKGLVYRGVKVMPYSTGCNTPLSNFESGQNYKDVVDPAAFVAFELVDKPNRFLVIWTTTPWTLPSNLAIAVHPEFVYVVVKCKKTQKELIVMKERLKELFTKPEDYVLIEEFKGDTLKEAQYKPVFPYFEHLRETTRAFRVVMGDFITTDQGTGVVHQAPYFGEIDYQTCLANEIVKKDSRIVCPVDETGCFTEEVTDYKGMYVKDADKLIMKRLTQSGNLVKQTQTKHSYPFCWRSDTPLLYMAVPSWFIRVESFKDKLLANNDKTYWVPAFIQEKRFGNWLRDARDWAISRNRFWGTPINLWVSEDFDEIICPSSIAELEELCGQKITDLHRESVDPLVIKSPKTAEGIDQTRGWFYTLLVLSTALRDQPPFKNLIVNGLVLASDGEKMSKRKKNYPDPLNVVGKYGADALRLYLIDSPVVRGENLRFREEGVEQVLKGCYASMETGKNINLTSTKFENVMDKWIVSFTNSLIQTVRNEMEKYRLYNVVTPLTRYFDILTNTYIRMNRTRFKSANEESDRTMALSALNHVLVQIVRLMAPFTPFFCEYLWQTLRKFVDAPEESVHFTMLPEPETQLIDETVERRVNAMLQVVDLTRQLRTKREISVRYPLLELVVVNRNQQFLDDVKHLEAYVLSESNIKKLTVSQDKTKYGVQLKAVPNLKALGRRLKGDQKKVTGYLQETATEDELERFIETGKMTIHGHEISAEDVEVVFTCASTEANADVEWETQADQQTVILLNVHQSQELIEEGLSREITNRIQKMRKDAKLHHIHVATAYCDFKPDGSLRKAAEHFLGQIVTTTATGIKFDEQPNGEADFVTNSQGSVVEQDNGRGFRGEIGGQ
ncbi:Isoleucine--tRNA ligase, cytoplasmic [Aphelenchoides bicaudatus]|nr:Isoleucine--tRNA ligase, cytoplasmic [Aphelenchoides bicaudatus]